MSMLFFLASPETLPAVPPPSYPYMMKLERIFSNPMALLQRRDIPYERRRFLLRQWRNERMRFLNDTCRDMDYSQDAELETLRHALDALKRQPRKYV